MKLFDVLKEKIEGLSASASDFLERLKNKSPLHLTGRGIKNPFILAVTGLLVLLAATGIIALAVSGISKKIGAGQSQIAAKEFKPLIFMHEPLPPKEQFPLAQTFAENGDYRLFRPRTKQWSAEEASEWFTPPSDAMADQLHAANNALIQNMLDSAP